MDVEERIRELESFLREQERINGMFSTLLGGLIGFGLVVALCAFMLKYCN